MKAQTKARTKTIQDRRRRDGTVKEFKYLGRITSDDDDDLPAVRDNLKKATEMGPSIERYNTRRRNSENDKCFYGGSIGIVVDPKRGYFQEDERNAGRLSPSMRETNDEAVHTPRPRE
jgi:hypothetical protein